MSGVIAVAACGSHDGELAGGHPDGGGADGGGPAGTLITIHSDGPLVALQDGEGPWIALAGSGGAYQARVVGPRYAVATVCPSVSVTLYQYRTVADPTEVDGLLCAGTATAQIALTITTTGFGAQALNTIFVGANGDAVLSGNGSQTIQVDKGRPTSSCRARTRPGPRGSIAADLSISNKHRPCRSTARSRCPPNHTRSR
jgi:hypothetical protein